MESRLAHSGVQWSNLSISSAKEVENKIEMHNEIDMQRAIETENKNKIENEFEVENEVHPHLDSYRIYVSLKNLNI